ncbi:FAD-dependent oxidoreductase [Clostridium estertheticum]|uniref:oxidoreductase n=1 Tax=Clostridium estertheticum TaxID=238834 RepID=UPI001C0AE14F|nr:FAD-dependent oxidoreductase [Clostridium estertheticum]MBU3074817.1 FAD-dependent oxidoreductase [Clostridium estertheticum]MBU3165032.1 FAD-dependent oxidoreductase [Clostridium estertheticum]MBU3214721.1 FAD-dependent oxidoreductase [Clostridium estertheticum]WAG57133.1 FAD-dependent oxidoreductase [Clostridium estertheticum]
METRMMFTPIKIGPMEIRNRLVVPAMGTNLAEHNGEAGEKLICYYRERAKGGFGLIITECAAVSKEGRSLINECGMWEDSLVQSYKKLTDAVHEEGAKIAVQLRHCGRETERKYTDGEEVFAPSPVPCPACQTMPHEMTTEEVYQMVTTFGDAALRAKKSGFDAVELHASHGYLIAQFLSGHANKRTDEFGGTLYNRMRFLRLILREVKSKVGSGFPVIVRISGTEMITGGREIQETKAVCQMCEEEGVDAIHVSISTYGSLAYCIGSTYLEPGYETSAAEAIKKAVSIPVITVGRFTDPEMAETLIRDGSADMVAFGRQSIADPHFVNKVLSRRQEDIIPCIGCGQGCIMHLFSDDPISCVVNPNNGTEEEYISNRTESPKHVLIAGGGPGGLQAAWILAARGHKVDLVEKENYLGGAFLPASYPPAKSSITKMIGYYIRQCEKYGVNITLNTELTGEKVKEVNPDTLIIATGSKNLLPKIKGINHPDFMNPCDVLLGKVVTGHKVLVAGGGLIGAETADFLAEQGREVTIVEMKPEIGADMDPYAKPMLLQELKNHEVTMLKNAVIQEFLSDGVTYKYANQDNTDVKILGGFDSVVLAMGTTAYNPFGDSLKDVVKEVYVIGDAQKAGKVYAATHEAADVAMHV